jgi:hypothetical protein
MGRKTHLFLFALIVLLFLPCTFRAPLGECAPIQVGLGVYWDYNCTLPVSQVLWNLCQLGQSKNVTLYFKNIGNVNITGMALITNTWNPAYAANYINLTWDYVGQMLEPSQVENITFTLSVNENANMSNFSFDIVIRYIFMTLSSASNAPSQIVGLTIYSSGIVVNPVRENPTLLALPVMITATAVAIIIRKRKHPSF